jgi:hypothetical protein
LPSVNGAVKVDIAVPLALVLTTTAGSKPKSALSFTDGHFTTVAAEVLPPLQIMLTGKLCPGVTVDAGPIALMLKAVETVWQPGPHAPVWDGNAIAPCASARATTNIDSPKLKFFRFICFFSFFFFIFVPFQSRDA